MEALAGRFLAGVLVRGVSILFSMAADDKTKPTATKPTESTKDTEAKPEKPAKEPTKAEAEKAKKEQKEKNAKAKAERDKRRNELQTQINQADVELNARPVRGGVADNEASDLDAEKQGLEKELDSLAP
jgi:hypothetical protein